MAYFDENYSELRFPLETDETAGWRPAQSGAVFALAGHFAVNSERALVAMPTGSGKSAVFMALPYILRARRVLVLTPSRVVRDQLAEDFRELATLKRIGALRPDLAPPQSRTVSCRREVSLLQSERNDYDVAIAVPAVFQSTDFASILDSDLFDLLIVDEAHHVAAPTWSELAAHFEEASQALFTATPVRRDRQALGARYVYVYRLSQALADGIFGEVSYIPAKPNLTFSNDQVIALETEQIFLRDQANGLDHRVLVRVDSQARANDLGRLYLEETGLRLKVIHSGHSYRRVSDALRTLKLGELDGVIAVDMLGEGFDFPKLKIGAVHTPHKSLAATLQFIGRFARTNDPDVGRASFVAAENDIKHEAELLWREDAAWHRIVPALADEAVATDAARQAFMHEFDVPEADDGEPIDLNTEVLSPALHAKAYALQEAPSLDADLAFPGAAEIRFSNLSLESATRVVVTREEVQPPWTTDARVARIEWNLVVLHYDAVSKILFICSSRKSTELYNCLAKAVSGGVYSTVELHRLNRVLRDMEGLHCFGLGMRNRRTGSLSESYRIMTGPSAELAISNSAKRAFHQGHVFAVGDSGGQSRVIGFSGSSKIWGAGTAGLPDLVAWLDGLGSSMADPSAAPTNTPLDDLDSGRPIGFPLPDFVSVVWPSLAYERMMRLEWEGKSRYLRDLDLNPQRRDAGTDPQVIEVRDEDAVIAELVYDPSDPLILAPRDGQDLASLAVFDARDEPHGDLLSFLRNNPPALFAEDFASYVGRESFAYVEGVDLIAPDVIEDLDWSRALNVNIRAETTRSGKLQPGEYCIIDGFCAHIEPDFDHIFVDDGSGEAADIIAVKTEEDGIRVVFAHCKASGDDKPGARIDDVYIVAGQVVKSVRLAGATTKLREHFRKRTAMVCRKGNPADVQLHLAGTAVKRYEVWLVQPGISKSGVTQAMRQVLSSADDYVQGSGCSGFRVFGSA